MIKQPMHFDDKIQIHENSMRQLAVWPGWWLDCLNIPRHQIIASADIICRCIIFPINAFLRPVIQAGWWLSIRFQNLFKRCWDGFLWCLKVIKSFWSLLTHPPWGQAFLSIFVIIFWRLPILNWCDCQKILTATNILAHLRLLCRSVTFFFQEEETPLSAGLLSLHVHGTVFLHDSPYTFQYLQT